MTDLVVIGGGPVGLITSRYAAGLGLAVTVLEPRLASPTPGTAFDKACGEGLMPGALAALLALGIDPVGMPFAGIRYVAGDRVVSAGFRAGPGRGVRRTVLHASLLEAAAVAGVGLVPLAAGSVRQDPDGVVVDTIRPGGGPGPRVRAPYAVAADGLHSPARRALGLEAAARRGGWRRHGLRRHSGIAPWSDHVDVHWSDVGEAYVTPVAADVVGIAILTERRAPFAELLAGFPELSDRLRGAPVVSPVLGAGPFRQRATRRVAGRVLLVGDASGYVDALTGEGLAVGIAQAREAVRALAAGRPADYEGAWRRVTWRSAALTHALVLATRPAPGRRLVVPAAQRLPAVFDAAVNALAGPG